MSKIKNNQIDKDLADFYSVCEETFFSPINLSKYKIPEDILNCIPEKFAVAHQVIPIFRIGNILTVAMGDPLNISALDSLRLFTKMEIFPVIAPATQVTAAIEGGYSLRADEGKNVAMESTQEASEASFFKQEKFNLEKVAKLSQDTKIVSLVNEILSGAVKFRASDIHVEPFEKYVRVRYRVDGILQEIKRAEKDFQEAIIARLKIMSCLDITQRRIPQDGRFTFSVHEKNIDVRVSILPVDFGEKIVMRLLDKANINLDIKQLGFSSYALKLFEEAVSKPLGMILLTGPTGSGKTTTLYTLLNRLNRYDHSLVTIEDPIEYNLKGVTQVPVKHEIGLGFSAILRATLRQSPDIIMVGEIRDSETADIAMKASLTGHIVFSTLHTNDAPSAITRLLNMDIEPFLISFSLNMIAAQRLVRKICPKCRTSYKFDLSDKEDIPSQYREENVTLYKGKGCENCGNTGYKGRLAVIEALSLDKTIRDMIIKRNSTEEIREHAIKNCGMKTLRDDAMDKCMGGETTFEEVLRVTADS